MPVEARYTNFDQFNRGHTTVTFITMSEEKRVFVKRVLRAGWSMHSPAHLARIKANWDAKSKNFKFKFEGHTYLLKENHYPDASLKELTNQAISYCGREGAKVPFIHPTNRGWNYYGITCLLTLFDFIHGENFDGSRKELRGAAAELAQLDRILERSPFALPLTEEKRVKSRHNLSGARDLFEKAKGLGARDESEEAFLPAIDYLDDKSASLSAARLGSLPRQPIHCNVQPQNLLFSPGGELLAFLDFDSIVFSQRAREVALAMHRLSRAYGENTERQEDVGADIRDRARDFLAAYNSVNPLEDAEMRALKFFLEEESLNRVLTILRNHYNMKNFEKDRAFPRRLAMLREAELFDFL